MTVPVSERGKSKPEFHIYHEAAKLRREVTFLLLHDFGIKSRSREPNFYVHAYGMEPTDAAVFKELCHRYCLEHVTDQYPYWIINYFRDQILDRVNGIVINITRANSVYPTTLAECDKRREYQDEAIRDIECVEQTFQYMMDVIPVDANRYTSIVNDYEDLISDIRSWRKSDNKIRRRIKKKV